MVAQGTATCVVFGGSKGIGLAIARLFAQQKCRVAVISRNATNISNGLEEIRQKGINNSVN